MKNINLPILPQSRTSQRTAAAIDTRGILATNDYEETNPNPGALSDHRKT
jgi:hypothetical protein